MPVSGSTLTDSPLAECAVDRPASVPDITRARKEVKRLTGESFVPVLVLDDGQVIRDSKNIMGWAGDNPATGAR